MTGTAAADMKRKKTLVAAIIGNHLNLGETVCAGHNYQTFEA